MLLIKKNVRTEIREEINSHVKAYQQYHKGMYDKKRCKPINFKVGDLVRIERQVPSLGQSKKLVPRFQGSYKITAILEHDRFQVEDTPLTRKNGRHFSTVVAIDKIAPWLTFDRPHAQDIATSSGNSDVSDDE